jgi:hypothetical protein
VSGSLQQRPGLLLHGPVHRRSWLLRAQGGLRAGAPQAAGALGGQARVPRPGQQGAVQGRARQELRQGLQELPLLQVWASGPAGGCTGDGAACPARPRGQARRDGLWPGRRRQKTVDVKTECASCCSGRGNWCGTCLFLRMGENIDEVGAPAPGGSVLEGCPRAAAAGGRALVHGTVGCSRHSPGPQPTPTPTPTPPAGAQGPGLDLPLLPGHLQLLRRQVHPRAARPAADQPALLGGAQAGLRLGEAALPAARCPRPAAAACAGLRCRARGCLARGPAGTRPRAPCSPLPPAAQVAHYLILTHLSESCRANPAGFMGGLGRAPARPQQRAQPAAGDLDADPWLLQQQRGGHG